MIYNWEKFKQSNIPWTIKGMKLTKVSIIVDGQVVKESYNIREIPHA
jgi:hypothetical protein